MFPPLRMNTLFPVDLGIQQHQPESVESLYGRYRALENNGQINPALSNRVAPMNASNMYQAPYTTNPNISYGLTPPNQEIATRSVDSIRPLDLAKLRQGEEKLDITRNKNENDLSFKSKKQEEDNAIRANRAAVYKFKAENPGMKFDFSGPTVKIADPIKGTVHDTGVPTGHLSDEDKINLNSANRINEIGTRASEQRITNTESNTQRGSNRLNEIAAQGKETRKTNENKPASASQTNQGYLNKATELDNSGKYKDYLTIKRNADGKPVGFTINPPKNGMGSDDPTYHEVNSKIYGGGQDIQLPPNDQNKSDTSTSTNSSDVKANSFNSSTTKLYTDKNGNKYNIPMDKIEAFLKDHPEAIEVK